MTTAHAVPVTETTIVHRGSIAAGVAGLFVVFAAFLPIASVLGFSVAGTSLRGWQGALLLFVEVLAVVTVGAAAATYTERMPLRPLAMITGVAGLVTTGAAIYAMIDIWSAPSASFMALTIAASPGVGLWVGLLAGIVMIGTGATLLRHHGDASAS